MKPSLFDGFIPFLRKKNRMIKKSKELVQIAIEKIEENKKNGVNGVRSGFLRLDEITRGWQPGELIVIAASPGMGKVAFSMSMVKNMAIDFDIPCAIFSLQMPSVQLITRMISSETGISSGKLRRGNLEPHEWKQLNFKTENLSNAPIFIDDTPSLSLLDLWAKALNLVLHQGVKIIIIDYLQLMTSDGESKENRKREISTISKNLKVLGKELAIPVIILSELPSSIENREGSKRPTLSDFRELGDIEPYTDIVSFIFRPEYYGHTEWDDDEHTPCEGQAELIIAKNRNGNLENIRLKFTGHLALFSDLES